MALCRRISIFDVVHCGDALGVVTLERIEDSLSVVTVCALGGLRNWLYNRRGLDWCHPVVSQIPVFIQPLGHGQ